MTGVRPDLFFICFNLLLCFPSEADDVAVTTSNNTVELEDGGHQEDATAGTKPHPASVSALSLNYHISGQQAHQVDDLA
jgi:hypothetical protein